MGTIAQKFSNFNWADVETKNPSWKPTHPFDAKANARLYALIDGETDFKNGDIQPFLQFKYTILDGEYANKELYSDQYHLMQDPDDQTISEAARTARRITRERFKTNVLRALGPGFEDEDAMTALELLDQQIKNGEDITVSLRIKTRANNRDPQYPYVTDQILSRTF